MDLVAGKQTSRKLPTQGSSDLSAMLWNGMGMGENGTACRALIFGRKRGEREDTRETYLLLPDIR